MNAKRVGAVVLSLLLAACSGSAAGPAGSEARPEWHFLGLDLFNRASEPHTDRMEHQRDD